MTWQAGSVALLALALAGGFAWYERRRPPAKVLALVAALAALAVVGRLAFAAIPNVKPTTDIVLFAGYALGAVPGFAVGAITAIVSNLFLGQGPWTVWQMAGWGGVGVAGALTARAMHNRDDPPRLALALVCGAAGLAFGAWMDVYQWTLAARQDMGTYVAVSGTSLPYNAAHAIGNVVFCLLIGPAFIRALTRYRKRFEVRWRTPALAGAVLLALLLPAAVAGAATPAQKAAAYLKKSQNEDGGFGAARGQASTQLHTGWSALGLATANLNPRDVRRRGGRSIVRYVKAGAGDLADIGEVERTILVLSAAGHDPRRFAGRDLVARMLRSRRRNGSFANFVSYTAFGILALRATGDRVGRKTAGWLVDAQNGDGGFAVSPAGASDADMTGVGLQALAAIGRSRGKATRRAADWLRDAQNSDGGFPVSQGGTSNSQSTAYAVLGLIAVGAAPGAVDDGLAYLRARQRGDGSVAYSASSNQTPVWVTAQALMALRRQPLPLLTVPRKKSKRKRASRAEEAGAAAKPASGEPRDPAREAAAAQSEETAADIASAPPDAGSAGLAAPQVETRSARGEGEPEEEGPPAWAFVLGIGVALTAVIALRRPLRRRLAS